MYFPLIGKPSTYAISHPFVCVAVCSSDFVLMMHLQHWPTQQYIFFLLSESIKCVAHVVRPSPPGEFSYSGNYIPITRLLCFFHCDIWAIRVACIRCSRAIGWIEMTEIIRGCVSCVCDTHRTPTPTTRTTTAGIPTQIKPYSSEHMPATSP